MIALMGKRLLAGPLSPESFAGVHVAPHNRVAANDLGERAG